MRVCLSRQLAKINHPRACLLLHQSAALALARELVRVSIYLSSAGKQAIQSIYNVLSISPSAELEQSEQNFSYILEMLINHLSSELERPTSGATRALERTKREVARNQTNLTCPITGSILLRSINGKFSRDQWNSESRM